jgi:hypothetical protein
MWSTDTIWFDISIVSFVLILGHSSLGHFEERSPRWRKIIKTIITFTLMISLNLLFGRTIAFVVLGLWLLPVLYIHGILLPRKGINGWTGEPKAKYYALRGWSTDIFNQDQKTNSPE